ncbi:MAG: SPOR domain-containing protein [Gammaproteobacteria bacterium]|nr:SPOR domain-containing protein [Gammaproteobacteria bacterium]
MNIQLKQRLVGAVVLVSLAIIIIPMLLPGEGSYTRPQQGSAIPAEPDYRFAPLPEPPPVPSVAEAPPVPMEALQELDVLGSDVVESAAKKTPSKVVEKPDIKPDLPIDAATPKESSISKAGDGQATAWVVQVGSFSSAKNAHALRDKLRKLGHATFVEVVKGKAEKSVYRVRVGPEVRRDLAEKLQQQLGRDAKLKGIVLRYP